MLKVLILIVLIGCSPVRVGAAGCGNGTFTLTAPTLAMAWEQAHWRRGAYPAEHHNWPAIGRVVEDPDLNETALAWIRMSELTFNEPFADATFQFLVGIASERIRLGHKLGKPTLLLNYLRELIRLHAINTIDLEVLQGMNLYFDRTTGLDVDRKPELERYMKDRLVPRLRFYRVIAAAK